MIKDLCEDPTQWSLAPTIPNTERVGKVVVSVSQYVITVSPGAEISDGLPEAFRELGGILF